MNYYYELCYFYSRSDSGSIYVETEINVNDCYDEDDFLNKLVECDKLEHEVANHIININEIEQEEYESFKY